MYKRVGNINEDFVNKKIKSKIKELMKMRILKLTKILTKLFRIYVNGEDNREKGKCGWITSICE